MKEEKQNEVIVKLSNNAAIKDTGNLHVYVVNPEGRITETARFSGDQATIAASTQSLEGRSKVYIAQALPEGTRESKKTERTLVQMNAYEVVKNFNGNQLSISRLPGSVINAFPIYNCLITGHVSKNFVIDGVPQKLPLCDLRVHICEVETELRWPYYPIYYRQIPDWVLTEIAQKIANIHVTKKPGPPDPIGPVSSAKTNLPLRSLTAKNAQARAKASSPAALPAHVLTSLKSGSVDNIRQTMVDYHDLIYPYLCLWPVYWPWIYSYDEETIVTTDCNGHFEMWENTFSEDGPLNIYIWIEALINGQWVTVYRPSLPCHTWWNYACYTDINITLTDPRLQPCYCGEANGPADAVWFRSIGESASALRIQQNTALSGPNAGLITLQGATLKNGGCTDILENVQISPFGGGLSFKLFCGANIFAAGVTHYRWKRKMITDANQNPVAGSPVILDGSISRPYLVKLSATHYETHYAQLGAEGVGADIAYRIPHHDVTAEPIPAADMGLSPEWTDQFFVSAVIDSTKLTDGIYEFTLELLKKQPNGSFTLVPVNKHTFQVSQQNNIGNNQNAPDAYLNINAGNATKADSYKMHVRIDNAPCVADIHDAMIAPDIFSGSCGFIRYQDTAQNVTLSFEASQPRNFAKFGFAVVKGNNSLPTYINPQAYVISSVPPVAGVTDFILSGGSYSADFTVLSLLNGCVGQAAFSENLSVISLATDGTNRLDGYDRYDVNAFALSNT